MTTLRLVARGGHLFAEVNDDLWLVDTGAPGSFGAPGRVSIAGEEFDVGRGYAGLDAASLAELVGVPCIGLLGADILGRFDQLLDVASGELTISTGELAHSGQAVPLQFRMGIPVLNARIRGVEYGMIFDTGAQYSYFQDASLESWPAVGAVTDFYPGVGRFETPTHAVEATLGSTRLALRCGRLPELLGMSLMIAGATGIVGNELFSGRVVGYFPRRSMLVL